MVRGVWSRSGDPRPIVLQAACLGMGERLARGPQAAHGEDEMLVLVIDNEHPATVGDSFGDDPITHWRHLQSMP